MRVLVTGGTGFLGSHTVRAIVAAGHRPRLLVRDPSKVRRVFDPLGIGIPESDVVVGDVTDEASVSEALPGCDAVYHGAALVAMRRAEEARVLRTNPRGAELVVGGAVERGLPSIVYASSLSVFFERGVPALHLGMPVRDGSTAYARSKARAERLVRRYQEEGAPVRISYPSGILGPDDPGLSEANHALYSFFVDLGVETSSGFQAVDVRDVAAVHLRQLELPEGAHRHMAAGPMLSWAETYALLDELVGYRLRRVRIPGAALRVLGGLGDAARRVVDFNFPLSRDAMEFATTWPGADASATETDLSLRFRPPHETYADTIRWLHRAGHLSDRQAGRQAG